jgi:ribosomal protein S27AE
MATPIDRGAWGDQADDLFAEIEDWRCAHPAATLSEIESAIEVRLAQLRDRLVTDTIRTSVRSVFGRDGERPRCPQCGDALQAKGVKRRQVTTHHGGTVDLERTYGSCPRCGAGLFPPGS